VPSIDIVIDIVTGSLDWNCPSPRQTRTDAWEGCVNVVSPSSARCNDQLDKVDLKYSGRTAHQLA